MQDSLFTATDPAASTPRFSGKVKPVAPDPALIELATALPPSLRLGTSSWTYPGWAGLVWDREYAVEALSRHGLAAYARHPLLRAVSLDRTFYKPLEAVRYAQYAAQVPDDFRFTVKAPAMFTDAMLRNEEGQGMRRNPYFLDAVQCASAFIEPLVQGLGKRLGPVVFQFSPLPGYWLERMPELIDRLHGFLAAIAPGFADAPEAVVAVEVRNRQWLTPQFGTVLKESKVAYCLGLHAKMPPISEQLPLLRSLWPAPLVCRWNLNASHGAFGYEAAAQSYLPYDKLKDPDPAARNELARVIVGVTGAGQNAYVTVSNEAEGCAPLTVIELAKAVRELQQGNF